MSGSRPTHAPSDVELLLAAGRELDHAAARLGLTGMLSGSRCPTNAVWSFSCSEGTIVLRAGRLEIEPPDVSPENGSPVEEPARASSSESGGRI